jgi:alkylation response protein AidB-like acyl-CoA dehydrogenase
VSVEPLLTDVDLSHTGDWDLPRALARIESRAVALDREPRFPRENFLDLAAAGVLQNPSASLVEDVRVVRAVAGVDASTARILDGHINGLERLELHGEEPLRSQELEQIHDGRLLLGVWGADPGPGEGQPAWLDRDGGGFVLRGVKTFCSGAGGVQRALVIASASDGTRALAYLDTTEMTVDRRWYRASGLRSSESHRVEFHGTPVLALLGGPGELSREPYFSRDAIRTSATWAGLADTILRETVATLDPRRVDDVQAHATIDRWLEYTALVLDQPSELPGGLDPAALALECRTALADSARLLSGLAAQACGSRPLVQGGALDRARRDLDLFLLQHRLDPKIAKLARSMLERESR